MTSKEFSPAFSDQSSDATVVRHTTRTGTDFIFLEPSAEAHDAALLQECRDLVDTVLESQERAE